MSLLLHIIMTYIKENITKHKYNKNYTAHPETLGRAINRPRYLWKNLFARAIYHPCTKYSLKGLINAKQKFWGVPTFFTCVWFSISLATVTLLITLLYWFLTSNETTTCIIKIFHIILNYKVSLKSFSLL